MEDTQFTLTVLSFVFFAFVVILIILWICMPFAVFGLKAKIDETNGLLRYIATKLDERK